MMYWNTKMSSDFIANSLFSRSTSKKFGHSFLQTRMNVTERRPNDTANMTRVILIEMVSLLRASPKYFLAVYWNLNSQINKRRQTIPNRVVHTIENQS